MSSGNKLFCDHEQKQLFRKKHDNINGDYYFVEDEKLKVSVSGGLSDAPFIISYDCKEYSASIGRIVYTWSFDG